MVVVVMTDSDAVKRRDPVPRKRREQFLFLVSRIHQQARSFASYQKRIPLPHIKHHHLVFRRIRHHRQIRNAPGKHEAQSQAQRLRTWIGPPRPQKPRNARDDETDCKHIPCNGNARPGKPRGRFGPGAKNIGSARKNGKRRRPRSGRNRMQPKNKKPSRKKYREHRSGDQIGKRGKKRKTRKDRHRCRQYGKARRKREGERIAKRTGTPRAQLLHPEGEQRGENDHPERRCGGEEKRKRQGVFGMKRDEHAYARPQRRQRMRAPLRPNGKNDHRSHDRGAKHGGRKAREDRIEGIEEA